MLAPGAPPLTLPPDASRRECFLALIRGRRRGLGPSVLRLLLWVASLGYGLAVRLHRLTYDLGWRRVRRVPVPVVSVGNLTVGGTGKTPCVEYVARFYRRRERLVAILSRGYGSEGGPNDEALVLEENLPDVPHLQGADRSALALTAVEELESEVLVLDDGLQHRRLGRDLELVLLDATDPWGLGHLLPRGLLREPRSSLRRAHAVLLTRCDQVEPAALARLRGEVARLAPGRPCAETVHGPDVLVNSAGEEEPLGFLLGRAVAGFCGIGNPGAFRRTLEDCGARVVDFRPYPDHHPYTREDVEQLRGWSRGLPQDAALVTTQKDLVKLRVRELAGRPLWALRIALAFRTGEQELHSLLESVLAG